MLTFCLFRYPQWLSFYVSCS